MNTRTQPLARPQGCTNLKLRQFMRRVTQHYDAEMSKVGLKTTQYSLLSYVDKLGPIRPVDLAAGIKMEPSTLTRNLKPLVDAGWVSVVAGVDARSRLVAITDAGRAKRAEAKRQWRKAQDGINALLGMDTVAALHALIDQSMDKLDPLNQVDGNA
ncbi:MAG: winged helix-turn-helix transcriptional regulator [Rhodoferax sp.]|nr:winged helix-turn-helix transcriptional regulator [Rhodoferax sp.]